MTMDLTNSVIHYRKKLEKSTDEEIILSVIHKLSKISISIKILEETHIGRCIRKLSKRQDIVGEKALVVLKKWRVAFINDEVSNSGNRSKSSSNSGSKKESTDKGSVKSTFKNYVKNETSNDKEKETSLTYSEHKQRSGSPQSYTQHSSKYKGSEKSLNMPEQSGSSLCENRKENPLTKYIDYDSHAAIYDPEVYPVSKIKIKKSKNSDCFLDAYNPSSVKNKSNLVRDSESNINYKNQKTDQHSKADSAYDVKQSTLKKEKHSATDKDKFTVSPINLERESNKLKHKSSSESNKSKRDSSQNNSSTNKAKKIKINCSEEFTSSVARFEDCLGFNDVVIKKKIAKSQSNANCKKSTSNCNKTSVSGSSSHIKEKVSKQVDKSRKEKLLVEVAPKQIAKTDEAAFEMQTNYQPLPQKCVELSPSKKNILSNEEAIKFTSSRKEKTVVYSGRRNYFTEVPSLIETCASVLFENIDAIEYMGGVPYVILKPILERCSPSQLFNVEDYNPYLLDDTNSLWEVHCKRDYKLLTPQENETWRDLYDRARSERETKLKNLTANISASRSKSNPVRQVKLAYLDSDSVVKPPRDVARRQAKHGTGLPVNHVVKPRPLPKVTPKPATVVNSVSSSSRSSTEVPNIIPKKPNVAPLMAKSLKSMKMCFHR